MNITLVSIAFAVYLISFLLRGFPRLSKPYIGHDAWVILLTVDELKKRRGFNSVTRHFLIKGEHDYPPLFFYFLALFPTSWLTKHNWAISPIIESANAVLVVLGSFFLTGDLPLSATAGIIYSFTPVVIEESFVLSTRAFGMVLFNTTMLAFLAYRATLSPPIMLLTILGGTLVLLAHKFTTEVLSLLFVSYAIAYVDWLPLLMLLGAALGATAISRGMYLKVIRGHVGIIRFWLRHHKDYAANYLNPVNKDHRDPSSEGVVSGTRLRRLWRRTKRLNPLYWLLRLSPFNPFALVAILLPVVGIWMSQLWDFYLWSVLTLILYYAATYLRFLGRYPGRSQFLDYNAFPTALLCSVFVWIQVSNWKSLTLLVAFAAALAQYGRSYMRLRTNRADDQSILQGMFDYLKRSPKDGVICLPASHSYAIPYFTGKRVFYTVSAREYEKLGAFFPVLTVPVEALSQEYGINFAIVDKKSVPVDALNLSSFKLVMECNDYVLLEKQT